MKSSFWLVLAILLYFIFLLTSCNRKFNWNGVSTELQKSYSTYKPVYQDDEVYVIKHKFTDTVIQLNGVTKKIISHYQIGVIYKGHYVNFEGYMGGHKELTLPDGNIVWFMGTTIDIEKAKDYIKSEQYKISNPQASYPLNKNHKEY
jgi:hypothetical protein